MIATQTNGTESASGALIPSNPVFVVLDRGAHQGLMTLRSAKCTGETGIVHAWEALPLNVALVARNAKVSACYNVVAYPKGVGGEYARLPIDKGEGNVILIG